MRFMSMRMFLNTIARVYPVLLGLTVWFAGGTAQTWSAEPGLLTRLEDEIASIFAGNRASVVRIHTMYAPVAASGGAGQQDGFTQGTGFVFDARGYILTVVKAVENAEEIRVILASGLQMPATFVASDPASEVAVIQVAADSLSAVRIGNSDRTRIGHYAFILGNTYGNLTPSFGTVYERIRDLDLIQIVAPVHPSYGGAPVFGSTGEALGVVWAILDPGMALRPSRSAGPFPGPVSGWQEIPTPVYVIPINRAIQIARRLVSLGEIACGYLGVEVDLTRDGAVVTGMDPRGPALLGGLRLGDVVVSYQGRSIAGAYHLRRLVMESEPGTTISLGLKRQGAQMTTQVEVGEMPGEIHANTDSSGDAVDSGTVMQRISGLEQELGGLRRSMQPNPNGPAQAASDQNQKALFQRIDNLEQEVRRLQGLLQR